MDREILAGQALLEVARAFEAGKPPPEAAAVAAALQASGEETADVLGSLRDAGLVATLSGGGLVPARPPARITLVDVRQALLGKDDPLRGAPRSALAGALREAEGAARAELARTTFADLCARAIPGPARAGEATPNTSSGAAGSAPSVQRG
jgi:membrane protein